MKLNKKEITLYNCLKHINNGFFEDFISSQTKRIVFQKYCLFFEHLFDTKIGEYSLYIYGPYNNDLADFGYKIARDQSEAESFRGDLTEDAVNIINEIVTVLPESDPNLLEVYSTYFYLITRNNISDNNILFDKLLSIKGHLMGSNPRAYFANMLEIHSGLVPIFGI